jgi:endo-1,4-beta-mannosidase
MSRPPRFGVNYVPSRNWWHSWVDWDRESIAADLTAIAALGLDHVRVQCLWPVFQPGLGYVSDTALLHLAELLDLADACGLDVCVAVLTGWLSGFAFLPSWVGGAGGWPARNMFTDPEIVAAEQELFTAIANRIGDHPRFLGFDLGNELGVLQLQLHPAATAQADAWAETMLAHCERVAPGKLHVNGVDHCHWFADIGFSRRQLATSGAATALHTWIKFTGALERYGPMGVGSLHLAEYCVELARAYQSDPRRPIWIQEFGCSSAWLASERIPDFLEQMVWNASGCAHVWGFTWWCSHDLSPRLRGFEPLEYDLGLLDTENRPKPAAYRIAALIDQYRDTPPPAHERAVGLVLPDGLFASSPDSAWRLGTQFMELVAEGVRPAIVLELLADDEEYLRGRGIRRLERLSPRCGATG